MKVGDLVKWRNTDNKHEIGVVTGFLSPDVVVWFFADNGYSIMTKTGLVVIDHGL